MVKVLLITLYLENFKVIMKNQWFKRIICVEVKFEIFMCKKETSFGWNTLSTKNKRVFIIQRILN